MSFVGGKLGLSSPPGSLTLFPFPQVTAAPESLGPLLLERQLVRRLAALATPPASRADAPWWQRGRLLDGVQ